MPKKRSHTPRPPARSVGDTPLPTTAEELVAYILGHMSSRMPSTYKAVAVHELRAQPLEKLRAMAQSMRYLELEREERRRKRRELKAAAANG
jgi:hypothetical protein